MRLEQQASEGKAALDDPGFGVYVHWPFCRAKCPYCDFNVHLARAVDEAAYRAAFLREIDHFAELAPRPACETAGSVYFGGGTPSLMAPETVAAIIERAAARWGLAEDAEITLEANPEDAGAGRWRAYRAAGVTRLSLGVEALSDRALAFLGRHHDAAQARKATALALAIFPRVSIDLIYARPGQTIADWRGELADALALGTGHISLYELTIERGTAFSAAHRRGAFAMPGNDSARQLYDETQALCEARGLPAYEISNHARPGAESRHNLLYWRGGAYAGIGPGAHGRLVIGGRRTAVAQRRGPEAWRRAVERDGHGTECAAPLSAREVAEEVIMTGLRLREGLSLARLEALALPLDEVVERARLARLVDQGLVAITGGTLRATAAGRPLLNALLAALLA